jgi:hypothetical protein
VILSGCQVAALKQLKPRSDIAIDVHEIVHKIADDWLFRRHDEIVKDFGIVTKWKRRSLKPYRFSPLARSPEIRRLTFFPAQRTTGGK